MQVSLGSSLHLTGISHAKGIELIAAREQLNATLPRGNGEATKKNSDTNQTQASSSQSQGNLASVRTLTPEQQQTVEQLKQIDRNVRAHEAAHMAAGRGVVTSGASFSYTYGPDGKQYATGGEVGIDTSAEEKPEANIDKGQRIQAAALAPRDPSPQDYRVASIGAQLEGRGRSDLARQQAEEFTAAAERPRIDVFV